MGLLLEWDCKAPNLGFEVFSLCNEDSIFNKLGEHDLICSECEPIFEILKSDFEPFCPKIANWCSNILQ